MGLDTYTGLKTAVASYLKRGDLDDPEIPDFIFLAEKTIETELNFVPNKNDTYTASATTTADQQYVYAPIGCIEPVYLKLESSPIRTLSVVSLRELARKEQLNTSGTPRVMAQVGNMRTALITVFAANGAQTRVTSAGHGLSAGDWVYITGTTTYNGRHMVTSDATDTFDIAVNFVADEASYLSYWKTYQPQILFDEAPSSAIDYTLYYRAKMEYLRDSEVTWLLSEFPQLVLYGTLVHATPFIKDDKRVPLWADFYRSAMASAKKQQWRQRASGGALAVRPDVPLPT